MTQVIAAFGLALILPYALGFILRSLSSRLVVSDLTPSIDRLDDVGEYSGTRFCMFEIPSLNKALLANISLERFKSLQQSLTPATVTVTKLPLCTPVIESVKWQDESGFESATIYEKGFFSAIWYFVAGLAFLAWSTQFENGTNLGYMSAALLALAGYWIMVGKTFSRSDVRQARVNVLGFHAGAGVSSLWMMAAVCLIGSIVLFSYPNILTLFLGMQTAIGFGMFINLLRRV